MQGGRPQQLEHLGASENPVEVERAENQSFSPNKTRIFPLFFLLKMGFSFQKQKEDFGVCEM